MNLTRRKLFQLFAGAAVAIPALAQSKEAEVEKSIESPKGTTGPVGEKGDIGITETVGEKKLPGTTSHYRFTQSEYVKFWMRDTKGKCAYIDRNNPNWRRNMPLTLLYWAAEVCAETVNGDIVWLKVRESKTLQPSKKKYAEVNAVDYIVLEDSTDSINSFGRVVAWKASNGFHLGM